MPKLSPTELAFYERVGARIRELRLSAKGRPLSQSKLAQKLGVNQNTVSRWESGEHRPTMLDALSIAQFFNVPISKLFIEDEDKSLAGIGSKGLRSLSEKDQLETLIYMALRRDPSRQNQQQLLDRLGLNTEAVPR